MTIQEMIQEARTLSVEERKQLIKALVDIVDAPIIEVPRKPNVSKSLSTEEQSSGEEDS